ncbi:hypothetical protein FACS189496_1770 [Bacilli bacterium]|nr:hypothetical protein FACS189496_1770 [Bacilli bacterium]
MLCTEVGFGVAYLTAANYSASFGAKEENMGFASAGFLTTGLSKGMGLVKGVTGVVSSVAGAASKAVS